MLSIINEIDPCLLLPLCVLYEIQNQIFQQNVLNFGWMIVLVECFQFLQNLTFRSYFPFDFLVFYVLG